jgi:hypothetical protein
MSVSSLFTGVLVPLRCAIHWWVETSLFLHRLLALGRSIADIPGSESIEPAHLAEAVQLRPPLKSAYCANDTM